MEIPPLPILYEDHRLQIVQNGEKPLPGASEFLLHAHPLREIPNNAENALPPPVGEEAEGDLHGEGGAVFTAVNPLSRIASPMVQFIHEPLKGFLKRHSPPLHRGGKLGGAYAAELLKRRELKHLQSRRIAVKKEATLYV